MKIKKLRTDGLWFTQIMGSGRLNKQERVTVQGLHQSPLILSVRRFAYFAVSIADKSSFRQVSETSTQAA
jgi:hypothetical protein